MPSTRPVIAFHWTTTVDGVPAVEAALRDQRLPFTRHAGAYVWPEGAIEVVDFVVLSGPDTSAAVSTFDTLKAQGVWMMGYSVDGSTMPD